MSGVWIVLIKRNANVNLWKNWQSVGIVTREGAENDGDSRALASVSDGRFVLCASVHSDSGDGVEAEKMSRRFTGVTDINGGEIYTGDTVKMHYFFLNGSPSGNSVWEDEAEIIGKVGKDWRGIYTKTKEGIKYHWKYYLQDPEAELEIIGGADNEN